MDFHLLFWSGWYAIYTQDADWLLCKSSTTSYHKTSLAAQQSDCIQAPIMRPNSTSFSPRSNGLKAPNSLVLCLCADSQKFHHVPRHLTCKPGSVHGMPAARNAQGSPQCWFAPEAAQPARQMAAKHGCSRMPLESAARSLPAYAAHCS